MASRKSSLSLLVGTRKGAFILKADPGRRSWKQGAPIFLGHIVQHLVQDPRDPKVLMMAALTGHLGPTLLRSVNRGRSWKEASAPPAFPKVENGGQKARSVGHT